MPVPMPLAIFVAAYAASRWQSRLHRFAALYPYQKARNERFRFQKAIGSAAAARSCPEPAQESVVAKENAIRGKNVADREFLTAKRRSR